MLSERVMLERDVQPLNAPNPMLVTLLGIVMLERDVQSRNACDSMVVMLSGMVMLDSEVQPENAESLICVTAFPL